LFEVSACPYAPFYSIPVIRAREGANYRIDYRFGEGDAGRTAALAREPSSASLLPLIVDLFTANSQ
jgi:hypothetical protein